MATAQGGAGPGPTPNIIPRSHWGAGAYGRCGKPVESGPVHAAVVHHTAGSNDYAPEDSAEIIRAIYAYHTRTLGWCDIGYNALVDKYGQVFEGRAGGLTRGIMGSHAGGFNRNTWGVSMIGTFDDAPPRRSNSRRSAGCWAGGWVWTAPIRAVPRSWSPPAARSPTFRAARH